MTNTNKITITLNRITTFDVITRDFDTLDAAHESGLFYDSDTATWYEPSADIVAYRRQRAAEFFTGAHAEFFAGQRRRYDEETDRMEAWLAAHRPPAEEAGGSPSVMQSPPPSSPSAWGAE